MEYNQIIRNGNYRNSEVKRKCSITSATIAEGETYHIANVWASKLTNLEVNQRIYAEKAIHDVLFEAQLGNLQKYSVKINESVNSFKRMRSLSQCESSSSYTEHSDSSAEEKLIEEVALSSDTGLNAGEDKEDIATKSTHSKTSFSAKIPYKQTYIVSPSLKYKSRNGIINKNISMHVATNTPNCLLTQISRYLRDCYDNCKSYLPRNRENLSRYKFY